MPTKLESEGGASALEAAKKEYDRNNAELTNLAMSGEAEGAVK